MNAALEESPFRRFWSWITKPPDEILADAARDGELMVARLRVFITVFLAISPIVGLLLEHDPTQNLIGLGVAFVFFIVACILAYVVRRTPYSAQVSMISAIIDVSLVSLGLLTFWFIDHPLVTSNSRILFECYFLAIGASALRYDARVTVIAGMAAILEHLGLSWLGWRGQRPPICSSTTDRRTANSPWASQVSRALVYLSIDGGFALELVRRAQRLRAPQHG